MAFFKRKKKPESEKKEVEVKPKEEKPVKSNARLLTAEGWRRKMKTTSR